MKKYLVISRGSVQLETDNIKTARTRMQDLGESSFIKYTKEGIKAYEATHDPVKGENE